MTKPDWAERLQRSRKREYDKGWADCEAHIIELLENYINDFEEVRFQQAAGLLKQVIALIKGEQE